MNYTENCHLPQWVESDRVLRTDFNEAFAALEEALTASKQAGKRLENLARDAYRQTVQDLVRHGSGGCLESMWVNSLTSREDAGGEGHGWNGKYGICHGNGGLPSLEAIESSAKEECYISTVPTYTYQSERAAVTFTSDGYGKIDQLGIVAWSNEHYTSTPFSFTVTMTKADGGSVAAEAGPFTTEMQPHSYLVTYYPVNFPLEPHTEYRMEFTFPEDWEFYGRAGFALATSWAGSSSNTMVLAAREAAGTLSKTITPPEFAEGAVGVVRWRGDGEAALAVNGSPLTAGRTLETVNAEGAPCVETEFPLEALPEGELTLNLLMEKGDGDLDVFDYGLIWK